MKTNSRLTVRLYHGYNKETGEPLYWTLQVKNATKPVTINGTALHAMQAKPGLSIGCNLSNVGKDNKSAFPHPALYCSFTKSICLVITKIKNGSPSHCVRYKHNYGRYIDLNDRGVSRQLAEEHPEMFNRSFTLLPYKPGKPHWRPEYGRKETGERARQMINGELARMKKAGLVTLDLGE